MFIAILGLVHLALAGVWNQTFDGGRLFSLYSADEIDTELSSVLEACPNLVQTIQCARDSIGVTFRNQSISVLRVTHPHSEVRKRNVLLAAGLTATVPIGPSFLLYVMKQLVLNSESPEIDFLLRSVVLHIVPVVNVDALDDQAAFYNASSTFSLQETNENIASCPKYCPFSVPRGIHLNRNFDFKWGFDDIGSSPRPCDLQYRGPAPFSEGETRAIRDYTQRNDIALAVIYEGTGNYYFTPPMFTAADNTTEIEPSDMQMMVSIANDAVFPLGAKVGPMFSLIEKTANGALIDWLYHAHIPAYEVALGYKHVANLLPDKLIPAYQSHWPQLLSILDRTVELPRVRSVTVSETPCDLATCQNATESLSVMRIAAVVENVALWDTFNIETRVLIDISESNFSFALHSPAANERALDRTDEGQSLNVSVVTGELTNTLLEFRYLTERMSNRSQTAYRISLERAKVPGATSFPPLAVNVTVTSLPVGVTAEDWMEVAASYRTNFTLEETVPSPTLPNITRDHSDSGEDYTPVIIGLSVAGSVAVLCIIGVVVFVLVKRYRPKPQREMLPPEEPNMKALEPSGIALQMDYKLNQI